MKDELHKAVAAATDRYRQRTPASGAAAAAAAAVMPGGDTRTTAFHRPYALTIRSAQGPELMDLDGHTYLDFLNNYTSLVHGHAHPEIVARVMRQLPLGTAYAAAIGVQRELAERIVSRVPSVELVRFCNSGTEATMFAVRAARAYTGRDLVIKIEGGYHGSHDMAEISVGPDAAHWGPAEQPSARADSKGIPDGVVRDVRVVPFNDAAAIERVLNAEGEGVAAVLMEPVLGVAGFIPPKAGYLQAVRALCDRHGTVLIFDEVQSLRVARGGAQERYGVLPDLTAMAKIIGGGFPVGAFGGRRDIMALFDPGLPGSMVHSGTFNGNAVTMVAGAASLDLLDDAALDRLDRLGGRLEQGMVRALASADVEGTVTRCGSLLHLHLCRGPIEEYRKAQAEPKVAKTALHLELLCRGVFIASRGSFNVSSVMGERHVDAALDRLEDALRALAPSLHAMAGFVAEA